MYVHCNHNATRNTQLTTISTFFISQPKTTHLDWIIARQYACSFALALRSRRQLIFCALISLVSVPNHDSNPIFFLDRNFKTILLLDPFFWFFGFISCFPPCRLAELTRTWNKLKKECRRPVVPAQTLRITRQKRRVRKPDFPQQIKDVPHEAVGKVAQVAIKESMNPHWNAGMKRLMMTMMLMNHPPSLSSSVCMIWYYCTNI